MFERALKRTIKTENKLQNNILKCMTLEKKIEKSTGVVGIDFPMKHHSPSYGIPRKSFNRKI